MFPQKHKLLRTLYAYIQKAWILGIFCILVFSVILSVVNLSRTHAATSSTLNFQGRLLNSSGSIVDDGYYNIQFKLYDGGTDGGPVGTGESNAGTNLWTESYYDSNGVTAGNDNRVRIVNGYFSVSLGSQTSFPGTIDWDQELWLTMNVGGTTQTATPTYDGEMLTASSKRTKLTAVPYAFTSGGITDGSGNRYTGDDLIQNQNSADQTADFRIDGTGRANTSFTSPLFDSITGGLGLGTSTATGVTIGGSTNTTSVLLQGAAAATYTIGTANNTGGIVIGNSTASNTISIGSSAGASNTQTINIGTSSTGSSTTNINVGSSVAGTVAINGATTVTGRTTDTGSNTAFSVTNGGTGDIVNFYDSDSGTEVLGIADGGAVIFRNQTDSATAFQVQNAAGTSNLFVADTTNSKVGIATTPSSGGATLQVGGTLSVSSTAGFGSEGTISGENIVHASQSYSGTNSAYGIYGSRYQTGGSNANRVVGVLGLGETYELGSGNTLDWAVGLQGTAGNNGGTNAGTVTNAASLYASNTKNSGTLTNGYGLYIENQTSATNDYGLYIQGADTYALFVDSGDTRLDGNLQVAGSAAFQAGSDYSTTGQSDDVDFGSVSLVRLTGASAQTITGIANGTDGEILTIINAASQSATISDESSSSTATNRIKTGTGSDLTLLQDASITLVYDSSASRWRVVGAPSTTGGGGSVTLQGAYDNGSAGDQIISLDATQDSLIFRNPASGGSDSNFILTIDQLQTSATGCNAGECGGLNITNAGTNQAIRVIQTGNTSASSSSGGAVNITNTGNTGAGLVIYSNRDSTASGALLSVRADNAAFDQSAIYTSYDGTVNAVNIVNTGNGSSNGALNLSSTNTAESTFKVSGTETGKGTVKITHTGTGTDSNASGLSIDLQGSGTAAQGIFLDASEGGTTGKLLNLRNDGTELLTLDATGQLGLNTGGTNTATLDVRGDALFKNTSDSTSAFDIQNAAGSSLLTADTSNLQVNIVGDTNIGGRYGNRLFSDSFESANYGLWSDGANGSTAPTVGTAQAHGGAYSLRFNPSSSDGNLLHSFSDETTVYARAWIYVSSQTTTTVELFGFADTDADQWWALQRNTSNQLCLYADTESGNVGCWGTFSTGGWHKVELRVTSDTTSTGTTQVWLDDSVLFSATNRNNGTALGIDKVFAGEAGTSTIDFYIDDIVVDTASTGTASSLNVDDSLHVGGTATFGSNVLFRGATDSANAFQIQNASGDTILGIDTTFNASTANINIGGGNFTNSQISFTEGGAGRYSIGMDDSGLGGSNGFFIYNESGGAYVFGLSDTGAARFRNSTDSTTGFQIQDASGTQPIFNVDTDNSRVGIMTDAPSYDLSFGDDTDKTIGVEDRSSNAAGRSLTISAGAAGAGASAFAGGALTLQGGDAAGSGNANGGGVTIAGGAGVGTGTQGLVNLSTSAFSSAAEQTFSSNTSITAGNVDLYSSLPVKAETSTGLILTVPDPAQSVIGRILYVSARSGSLDFTLRLNAARTPIDITMKANSTATLIWNGTDWTAAGASSSTDLQAAYNNTIASAGGAELVLNAPGGNADGLTIRNNASTPIVGGLLEVQTSVGSNLFSVNNNATEYADNGGAESSTFTMWTASPSGGSASRYTTTGNYVATGQASVAVSTTGADHGAGNVLTQALTNNLQYSVSLAVRATSSFSTLDVVYSPSGTFTGAIDCATDITVTEGKWTRVNCTFTAPSSGITSANAIYIIQSDGASRTFYVDNLSVNVGAATNHAADGSVDSALGTNWTAYGTLDNLTRDTSTIYDTSGSVAVDTPNAAGRGVRNNLSITPATDTQYLVTFYARSSNTFNDIEVVYSRDGGSSSFIDCVDYNTQSVSTTGFTKITCLFTTDSTTATDPDLIIWQGTGSDRVFYIDALSVTLNTNTASNVQVGGGNLGGPTTLFTLDRSAGAPIADNNDAYLGSMYYDTITGRIQCYEEDGWGACGAAPDNYVNLNPEYAGAVLNGAGVGTMTADLCASGAGLTVNDGTGGSPTLCASGESRNFYRWTSPQATQQTYSIYVSYQLPETFNGFASDDTVQLVARTDSTSNAAVTYEMFKSTGTSLAQCGTGETTVVTTAGQWESVGINGNESTGCSFNSSSAGDFIIFKINMKANSNANAYVSTLSFVTTGR